MSTPPRPSSASPGGVPAHLRDVLVSTLKNELYAYCFGHLDRAVYELYALCEYDANEFYCKDVIEALRLAVADFEELSHRLSLLITSPPPANPAARAGGIAWEVRRISQHARASQSGTHSHMIRAMLERMESDRSTADADGHAQPRKSLSPRMHTPRVAGSLPSPAFSVTTPRPAPDASAAADATGAAASDSMPLAGPPIVHRTVHIKGSPASDRMKADGVTPADAQDEGNSQGGGGAAEPALDDKPAPVLQLLTKLEAGDSSLLWGDILIDEAAYASFAAKAASRLGPASPRARNRSSGPSDDPPSSDVETKRPSLVNAWKTGPPRTLHEKLSSPQRQRPSPQETARRADERQAAAEANRGRLALEVKQKLADKSNRLRGISAKAAAAAREHGAELEERLHAAEVRHEEHLRSVQRRAGAEAQKVQEVAFINDMTTQDKRAVWVEKLARSEERKRELMEAKLRRNEQHLARVSETLQQRRAREAAHRQEVLMASKERLAAGSARRGEHLRAVVSAAAKAASPGAPTETVPFRTRVATVSYAHALSGGRSRAGSGYAGMSASSVTAASASSVAAAAATASAQPSETLQSVHSVAANPETRAGDRSRISGAADVTTENAAAIANGAVLPKPIARDTVPLPMTVPMATCTSQRATLRRRSANAAAQLSPDTAAPPVVPGDVQSLSVLTTPQASMNVLDASAATRLHNDRTPSAAVSIPQHAPIETAPARSPLPDNTAAPILAPAIPAASEHLLAAAVDASSCSKSASANAKTRKRLLRAARDGFEAALRAVHVAGQSVSASGSTVFKPIVTTAAAVRAACSIALGVVDAAAVVRALDACLVSIVGPAAAPGTRAKRSAAPSDSREAASRCSRLMADSAWVLYAPTSGAPFAAFADVLRAGGIAHCVDIMHANEVPIQELLEACAPLISRDTLERSMGVVEIAVIIASLCCLNDAARSACLPWLLPRSMDLYTAVVRRLESGAPCGALVRDCAVLQLLLWAPLALWTRTDEMGATPIRAAVALYCERLAFNELSAGGSLALSDVGVAVLDAALRCAERCMQPVGSSIVTAAHGVRAALKAWTAAEGEPETVQGHRASLLSLAVCALSCDGMVEAVCESDAAALWRVCASAARWILARGSPSIADESFLGLLDFVAAVVTRTPGVACPLQVLDLLRDAPLRWHAGRATAEPLMSLLVVIAASSPQATAAVTEKVSRTALQGHLRACQAAVSERALPATSSLLGAAGATVLARHIPPSAWGGITL